MASKISDIVNFSPGNVVYEEFTIDGNQEWKAQIDNLTEDLLQVAYPDDVLLDVGWYPAHNRKGQFQVRVIRDFQWDEPIFYAEVASLDVLRAVLEATRRTAAEAGLVAA
ncbi:MAG: hypothetical protein R3C14_23120 [Caldilineaceae bacterium]